VKLRIALFAVAVAGCSYSGEAPAPIVRPAAPAAMPDAAIGRYIKHVVIVVQENRSFDNFFRGFPGADSAESGTMHDGMRVALRPTPLTGTDLYHDWSEAIESWDHGKMDGFDLDHFVTGQVSGTGPYAYVVKKDIVPYWSMASQYVLADHMFPTMFGPSFTGHLTLIAGTTDLSPTSAEVNGPNNTPWGCDAPSGTITNVLSPQRAVGSGPFPCFTAFRTMADSLDAAHVSWRYYAPPVSSRGGGGNWSSFDAIRNVRYGSDWRNVVSPQTRFLLDAKNGNLAAVSWVIPDAQDSDHVGPHATGGPSWVASIVNAVGTGPNWKTTAIVVVWDDWGGWYDHVPPPQLDFRGLGIRVPCIIVSPYAKPHHVSHTVYEFGSILRFVEQTFGLPPLGATSQGYTDTRAHSLSDSFDFRQKPRTFTPIPAPLGASYFLTKPPSYVPPDNE
jgi:phospholipase C